MVELRTLASLCLSPDYILFRWCWYPEITPCTIIMHNIFYICISITGVLSIMQIKRNSSNQH